ncbi:MAG: sodium:calcium antiporter [Candidatus Bathyarchaeia archaeon]
MFEQMGLLGNVAVLMGSLLALNKGSDLIIDNSVKVADITGLGKTAVGFILVALSTTLPELSVSVLSALGQGTIGVAIGNAVGSNIVNICLILGICFLLITIKNSKEAYSPLKMTREEIRSLYFGIFIASIVPLSLIYIGYASRLIGILLIAIFTFYNIQILKRKKKTNEILSQNEGVEKIRRYVFMTFLGAAVVVASSYFIVGSSSYIAINIGIPSIVIGATIIAFGTSLPELVNSINATKKGHIDLALGNIVGSGFINTTLILGVTLIASPLRVNTAAFSNLILFSIITNLFLWYFLLGEKISWREGSILLFLYFLFLITSFGIYKF